MAQSEATARVTMTDARHVYEFPLVLEGADERELRLAFAAGRQAYNALLGEALRRLELMRETRAYRRARAMPKGAARTAAFRSCRTAQAFSAYSLHHFVTAKLSPWPAIAAHLDRRSLDALSDRAFAAVEQHAYGNRGRPRFLRPGELGALEGSSNAAGIRYRDGGVVWGQRRYRTRPRGHTSPERHAYETALRVCRVRLVRRQRGTRVGYAAQLVLAGAPFVRDARSPRGIVGIDPGPRRFAIVAPDRDVAALVELGTAVDVGAHEERVIRRAIDRSRRATNPERFAPDGQVIRGPRRPWLRSRRYARLRARLADAQRRAAATRRAAHGRVMRAVLALGSDVRVERNVYGAWQRSRHFTRSVASAAPGAFVTRLTQRAALVGARVRELPTTLRLSRICHGCGMVRAKALGEREHACPCGIRAPRDVYSAFLACSARFDPRRASWRLDATSARRAWARGLGTALAAASGAIDADAFARSVELIREPVGLTPAAPARVGADRGEGQAMRLKAGDVVRELMLAEGAGVGRGSYGVSRYGRPDRGSIAACAGPRVPTVPGRRLAPRARAW